MNFSEEYLTKIREEFEKSIEPSAFWREFLKELIKMRFLNSRQLENSGMGSVDGIYRAVKTQGEISGFDTVLRIIFRILNTERINGITGNIPGF